MKNILLLITSFVLLSSSCKKSKPTNPVDQLPPETQTGANTFGCLVNGEVFKPGGAQLSGGSLQSNFQYLGPGPNGGYYFVLIGRSQPGGGSTQTSVGVFADSIKINESIRYALLQRKKGNASADYFGIGPSQVSKFDTDGLQYTGELFIKKLDTVNQIVSGTFWFDGINSNGQKVEVREGRFDVRYTR